MAQLAQDTFTRANQSGFGTSSDGNTWSTASGSSVQSIASNEGHCTTCNSATFVKLGSGTSANAEGLVRLRASDTNATSSGIVLRATGSTTFYRARLSANSSSVGIALIKVISGTSTNLFTASFTQTASTYYWLRFRCVGTSLFAKVWADGNAEPGSWTISGTDSSISSAGNYGIHTNSNSTSTTWDFDNFTVTDGVAYHDATARFRLLATKTVDAIFRFGLQSVTQYKDTIGRFGLQAAASQVLLNAIARFRLQSGQVYKDLLSRFRLQSGQIFKDAIARFRQQSGVIYHDALSRFRLQSGTMYHDAVARFRQQSGTTYKNALARFRLQSGVIPLSALARFRLQSGIVYHDVTGRLRLQSGQVYHMVIGRFGLTTSSMPLLNMQARFGLVAGTRATITLIASRGSVLLDAPRGSVTLAGARDTITLEAP